VEHRRSAVRLAALQSPYSSLPLPPFPVCAGFPRLGVLRRLRPVPDRSVDDGPSPRTALATRCGGRTGTVPVFTADRLSQEAPDSVPAASPRLRRRHSPWPPGPASTDLPGSFPTRDEGLGAHRYRPRSARFRAGDSLRDVNAGSSRTPLRLARRTRPIWQCWTVPALSRLLPPSPAPPGSDCRQLRAPRCDGVRGEGLPPPLGQTALSTAHVVVKSN
jgi:hypothetical protein